MLQHSTASAGDTVYCIWFRNVLTIRILHTNGGRVVKNENSNCRGYRRQTEKTLWYMESKPQILVLTFSETFKFVTCNVRGSYDLN